MPFHHRHQATQSQQRLEITSNQVAQIYVPFVPSFDARSRVIEMSEVGQALDKPVRVRGLAEPQRCLLGEDTACSLTEPVAALADATIASSVRTKLLSVIQTGTFFVAGSRFQPRPSK